MDVELERTGGLVGRTVRWSVDVDALPAPERAEVQDLLAQASGWSGEAPGGASPVPAGARPGADRFRYRLRASAPDAEPLDVRFAEPLPEPAQRLVALVRTPPGPAPT